MRPTNTLVVASGLAAALWLSLAPTAKPQDGAFDGLQPHYWPNRSFGFPIDTQALNSLANKPTHLQLYYASNRGAWQKGPKAPVGALAEITGDKRGILWEAPRDGDYEFAVQLVYADGSVAPKSDALAPEKLDKLLQEPERYIWRADGLAIVFNQYEVAAYVMGRYVVHVPYGRLAPLMRPDAPIGK